MVTFFSTPRPFIDPFTKPQRNALKSWKKSCPSCEIILLGDEIGEKEVCQEFEIIHIPEVECNKYGTPFVNSAFNLVEERAKFNILCWCNTDIVLIADIPKILEAISFKKFLLVGRRIDWGGKVDVDNINVEEIKQKGRLHPPCGIDYFIFTKFLYPEIPNLLVGRTEWDNWLVREVLRMGVSIIDGTEAIVAIHQNHPRTPLRNDEVKHNRMLTSVRGDVRNSQYYLKEGQVVEK